VRFKSPPIPATVRLHDDHAEVDFARGVRAITPGQAAVFYDSERVIGGGVISRAFK
jgi:tRNA-specific 2-thiouridylase